MFSLEQLEPRVLLSSSLLGVTPDLPLITYDSQGVLTYDHDAGAAPGIGLLEVDASPVAFLESSTSLPRFVTGNRTVQIRIEVDSSGNLVGGVAGDDLVVEGNIDIDGNGPPDVTGTLLTGEILAFGAHDSGGPTDLYDFRFAVTGGALADAVAFPDYFAGKDIGVTTTSEQSDFVDDFSVDFSGEAKGNIGVQPPLTPPVPGIDIEKLTNGQDADDPNGADVPVVAPGSTVTWTYQVTNTGTLDFDFDEVEIVDDNGTPGDASDDFSTTAANGDGTIITFDAASDDGSDGVLSPGEVWLYNASATAEDLTTSGATTTFDFAGSGPSDGPDGNIRTFTSDGISVNASAFSDDGSDWEEVYLGRYSSGLGVTDTSEGGGGSGQHRVDNMGERNYVLFEFSQQVVVDQARLESVGRDSDISVWIGTIADAFNTHVTLSDAVLLGMDWDEQNNIGHGDSRWADFNAGEVAGNVLIVAASTVDKSPEDEFKIRALKVSGVEEDCYENYAVVTTDTPGVEDTDLSHYCTGIPGIDIEKLTNGNDADKPQGADVPEIAPGDTVTWTYLVTNTGEIPFAFDDVEIVDDNGTPANGSDDFSTTAANGDGTIITFDPGSDVGSDLVLSPGEVWTYAASATAADLAPSAVTTVINFDTDANGAPLPAGTIVDDEYAALGLSIMSHDQSHKPAMIFDSANPTGGDNDLGTPGYHATNTVNLGNVLIISEDGDQNDPDDNRYGGTLKFTFDDPVYIDTISLLDIDSSERGGAVITVVHAGGTVTIPIPALGDNSVQTLDVNVADVIRMDVRLCSSGAVTELVYRDTPEGLYGNKATVTADGVSDMDPSHYRNPEPPPPPKASLGDYVWYDTNKNGVQDDGEEGVADVKVKLYRTGPDGKPGTSDDEFVGSMQTDADGEYLFEDLDPGSYYVKFVAPTGYQFTQADQGDDALDSDADRDGITGAVTLAAGEINRTLDAGLIKKLCGCPKSSISGTVFVDKDNDGKQDRGERGIKGVKIKLVGVDCDGNKVVRYTRTNCNGNYKFKNLRAGTYKLIEVQPRGYRDGKDSVGSAGGTLGNDIIRNIHLGAQMRAVDYDFGERLKRWC